MAVGVCGAEGSASTAAAYKSTFAIGIGFAGCAAGITDTFARFAFKAKSTHTVVRADSVALVAVTRVSVQAVVVGVTNAGWELITLAAGGITAVSALAIAIVVANCSAATVVTNIASSTICITFAGSVGVSCTLTSFAFKALSTLLVGGASCQTFFAQTGEAIGTVVVGRTGSCGYFDALARGPVALIDRLTITVIIASCSAAVVVTLEAVTAS